MIPKTFEEEEKKEGKILNLNSQIKSRPTL